MKIDLLPKLFTIRRNVLQSLECLLVPGSRLSQSRVRHSFRPGLPGVAHRLVPALATKGMVSQRFEIVLVIVACPFLDRFENLRMECDSSGAKQLPVSYLTGNRVLERILQLGEQVCFIKEFRRLKMRKAQAQIFVSNSSCGLK